MTTPRSIKTIFVFAILIAFVLPGCKHDAAIPQTQNLNWCGTIATSPSYISLKTGSYWVYDWYVVDSAGNSTYVNKTDSICITGDTTIGANTYAVFYGGWFGGPAGFSYWRDSSGCLVDLSGTVSFSETNFTDTLYLWNSTNGNETGFLKMDATLTGVSVPAGTFAAINAKYTVVNNVGTWPCLGTLDIHNSYYTRGIGRVKSTFQYTSDPYCKIYEGRLRNFHIN